MTSTAYLETIRLYGAAIWIYVILYQFVYPIGISEGHPLSIFIPIRIDVVGIVAFACSFLADLLIRKIREQK